MPDEKLTDNEIVKVKEISLEKQIEHYNERLKEVFEWYNRRNTNDGEDPLEICVLRDSSRLIPKLVDLINRLQAENERLTDELKVTRAYIHKNGLEWGLISHLEFYKNLKAEAYKECIEKVKSKLFIDDDNFNPVVTETELDNTLKELVGEDDGKL